MPSQTTSQVRDLIARNIDRAIQASGLTNKEVGDRLGVGGDHVWKWRNGRQIPRLPYQMGLSDVFGEPDVTWLFVEDHSA